MPAATAADELACLALIDLNKAQFHNEGILQTLGLDRHHTFRSRYQAFFHPCRFRSGYPLSKTKLNLPPPLFSSRVCLLGVGLYFIFNRRITMFAVICTLLNLPHLLMCFFGDSFARAEMDPLRLLTFSAGNHRYGGSHMLCSFTLELQVGYFADDTHVGHEYSWMPLDVETLALAARKKKLFRYVLATSIELSSVNDTVSKGDTRCDALPQFEIVRWYENPLNSYERPTLPLTCRKRVYWTRR